MHYYTSAWHVKQFCIFPHTARHRFLKAICENDFEEIELLLDRGFDPNDFIDYKYELTPLGLAAMLNRSQLIQYLYLRGADVNKQDKNGLTPLM